MMRPWLVLGLVSSLAAACGDSGTGTDSASSTDGSSGGGSEGSSGSAPTTSGGGTAGTTSGGSDSATSGGGDPFGADPVCSRDEFWTKGNLESPLMHPGMACLTCHSSLEPEVAAEFPIAGTVYPTGHEPDDCFGLNGGSEPTFVEITMADARVVKLPVNSSGNFLYDVSENGGAVMFPITARVLQGDQERKMFTPQSSGDCNSCHTQTGANGAPGRIVTP
jgi:hypothetical protein